MGGLRDDWSIFKDFIFRSPGRNSIIGEITLIIGSFEQCSTLFSRQLVLVHQHYPKWLSAADGIYCCPEVLNGSESEVMSSNKFIHNKIDDITVLEHIGFTVNAQKHDLKFDNFFTPNKTQVNGQITVFYLIRENLVEKTVSQWVSRKLNNWSNNTHDEKSKEISDFVLQAREIPKDEFRALYKRSRDTQLACATFAKNYCSHLGILSGPIKLSYESLYRGDAPGLKLIEECLNISLPTPKIADGKILPEPHQWISNIQELTNIPEIKSKIDV